MGTRISLGKGFTFGASGLRYGRTIPGLRRGYVSVGRSGTLLTGAHLRHWQPAAAGAGYAAAQRSGRPVRRTPAQWADIRSATDDLRAAVARYEELQVWARDYLAGLSPEVREAMARTPEGRDALAHARGTHPGYLRARDQLADNETLLASAPAARAAGCRWDAGMVYTAVLILAVAGGLVWAAFAQQAGFHRADQAAGVARARAVGAPGICIADAPDQTGFVAPSTPDYGGQGRGHYSWHVSASGVCDPNQREHFVPAN